MAKKRRKHSSELKFKIGLEAVKGVQTVSQLAAEYNVHPTQIGVWKKQILRQGSTLFFDPMTESNGSNKKRKQRYMSRLAA